MITIGGPLSARLCHWRRMGPPTPPPHPCLAVHGMAGRMIMMHDMASPHQTACSGWLTVRRLTVMGRGHSTCMHEPTVSSSRTSIF